MSANQVESSGAESRATSGEQALFLIGVATLVPELVWARQLGEVVGSDLEGISITLSTYLLGSALGMWLGARHLFEPRRWGWAALGGFIVGSLWCGHWAAAWTVGWGHLENPLGRVLLALPMLPYPLALTAMIPAWFGTPWEGADRAGRRAGRWIAALDVGSALGALATPLLLLPWVGATATAWMVAGVLVAGQFLRPPRPKPPAASAGSAGTNDERSEQLGIRIALVAMAGAVSLGLQVVWTRLLGEILGTSLVILGLAAGALLLGGALGSRWAPRLLETTPRGSLLLRCWCLWIAAQAGSALLVAAAPHVYLEAMAKMPLGSSSFPIKAVMVVLALVPPGVAAGFLLPVLLAGWNQGLKALARDAGRLQAAGLLGGTVGALGVGLFLVPTLGSGTTLWIMGAGTVAGAASTSFALAESRSTRSLWVLGALVSAAGAALAAGHLWNPALLGAGVFQWSRADVAEGQAFETWKRREILYAGEGRLARVTIERAPNFNATFLRVGGRVEGSVAIREGEPSLAHLPTVSLLGVLPTLFLGERARTLIVGVGGGTTVATAAQAGSDPITALEVEPEVLAALQSPGGRAGFPWETARLFPADSLDAPLESASRGAQVEFVVADARAFLHRTRDRWDAIVCQPSEPWLPWSASLFTPEFFERVRTRLAPGGVAVHWLQLYRIDFPEFAAILRSFRDTFDEVQVFHPHPATGEVVLVGFAPGGPSVDARTWQERWESPRIAEVRRRAGWPDGIPWPLLETAGVDRWLAGRERGRAARGRLEHRLPLLAERGSDYSAEILRSLLEARRSDPEPGLPRIRKG